MSRATAAFTWCQENAELEIDPDPALEREAEEAAQRAMAGGPVTVDWMRTGTYGRQFGGSYERLQASAAGRQRSAY